MKIFHTQICLSILKYNNIFNGSTSSILNDINNAIAITIHKSIMKIFEIPNEKESFFSGSLRFSSFSCLSFSLLSMYI